MKSCRKQPKRTSCAELGIGPKHIGHLHLDAVFTNVSRGLLKALLSNLGHKKVKMLCVAVMTCLFPLLSVDFVASFLWSIAFKLYRAKEGDSNVQ